MADVLTKKQRSILMSKIRSMWTKQEKLVHNYLKGKKIRHYMHSKIVGNPDITLKDRKVAIFLDGCFWHGCPKCYREPKSRKRYWAGKIQNNRRRDAKSRKVLSEMGYNVLAFWEHQVLENSSRCVDKIEACLHE